MKMETAVVEELRSRLRGDLLQPGDDAYETTRRVWNEMVDKRPALIVTGHAARSRTFRSV